jgi:hypothetical protein
MCLYYDKQATKVFRKKKMNTKTIFPFLFIFFYPIVTNAQYSVKLVSGWEEANGTTY